MDMFMADLQMSALCDIRQYADSVSIRHVRSRSDFWTTRLVTEQSQPRRLWRSFDELLGRGRAPLSSDVDADTLHHYFDNKVAGIRASTNGADSPTFMPAPVGCELRLLIPVSLDEVTEMVRR